MGKGTDPSCSLHDNEHSRELQDIAHPGTLPGSEETLLSTRWGNVQLTPLDAAGKA